MEHAEQDILHLLNRLFLLLDQREYGVLAELFAPDGRWHRRGHWLEGRAAIPDKSAARSETMLICRVISNGFAEVTEPGAAEAHCVMTAYRHDSDAPPEIAGPAVLARVRTMLAHTPEGWRIREIAMRYLFTFAALPRLVPAS